MDLVGLLVGVVGLAKKSDATFLRAFLKYLRRGKTFFEVSFSPMFNFLLQLYRRSWTYFYMGAFDAVLDKR